MADSEGRNSSSSYMALLNSLASDLDLMLNELCESRTLEPGQEGSRGDNFLEPYLIGSEHNSLDTSPLLTGHRRQQLSPNQNTGFRSLSNGDHAISNGFSESPLSNRTKDERVRCENEPAETERRQCLEDMEALASQNKQQLNEILKLAAGQKEVVSTGRSGRLISDFRHPDTDDNTSEDTLSQRDDELSLSDDAGSENSECDAPCGISLMERLIRSHPVWFLPGIQRTGAVHLLQGKEEGNFVVRQSSQPDTMAISVRLPPGKGPYIEHYLIQATGTSLSLESSENTFDSIPNLIAHYAQCCDELPVQLTLPRNILEAKNRQQLSSFALLGQEFWRYPMAQARPSDSHSNASSPSGSLSSFGSVNNNSNNKLKANRSEIVLDLAPLPSPTLSTFKMVMPDPKEKPTRPSTLELPCSSPESKPSNHLFPLSDAKSPAASGKTPPPPPPRWAKPSPSPPNNQVSITTTVTFTMKEMQVQSVQVTPNPSLPQSAESDAEPSSMSLNLSSPCSEQSLPYPSTASPPPEIPFNQTNSRLHTLVSPISDTTNHVSKGFQKIENTRSLVSTPTEKNGRNKRYRRSESKKESQHYKEFDILESQNMYYRSELVDKQSDYEDVWAGDSFKTFKPEVKKPPDLLEKVTPPPSLQHLDEGQSKQNSPFYAEPADSIKPSEVVRRVNRTSLTSSRHSDPSHFAHWPTSGNPYLSGGNVLPRIDSRTELVDSLSADNILKLRSVAGKPQKKNVRGKAVQPPRVTSKTEPSWTVDSSWEFICKDGDGGRGGGGNPFPSLEQQMDSEHRETAVTVRHIIAQRFPHFRLEPTVQQRSHQPSPPPIGSNTLLSRVSAYDNLEASRREAAYDSCGDEDAATVFSEPWDSSRWENLLMDCGSESTIRVGGDAILDTEDEETVLETPKKPRSVVRGKSFKERLDPLLSPPRLQTLRSREQNGPGSAIRTYALHLASDKTTTFAQNIDNFITCTLDAKESNPQVVMRNMRQFMSGMKNYLVKHGEREFEKHVEKERMKLKATEFLNLDAILEGVMHKLVVRPLKDHIYKLFVDEYTKTGAIQLLHENILYARTKPTSELGIKAKIMPPSEDDLRKICRCITALQEVDSPLEKLECLLSSISAILNSVSVNTSNQKVSGVTLGADDFLPMFVWVLVQSGFIAAEIEAEFMWGLLHPSLLSGEGGYYLTTLSSAVNVLKTFKACQTQPASTTWKIRDVQSVLKVVVPDELHGSIITTTLPVRPHMTTRDVCKIIAHKVRITNPQDYALFKLVDGDETLLGDIECPQDLKAQVVDSGKHCMLAYKRIDAKIAWPNT